jgi:hypothetical protein
MIISWFTQPRNPFSSYYQYDTVTRQFSRIRLELARNEGADSTCVMYRSNRTVGFSEERYSNDAEYWSIKDGVLCYKGTPLPSTRPRDEYRVYDTSDPSKHVHCGRPVTKDPELLKGIEAKHLALLANKAMITKEKDDNLTPGDASEDALANTIKSRVCALLNEPNFDVITDKMILDELTSQSQRICVAVARVPVSGLSEALAAAESANAVINKQITDGAFVPNGAFQSAFNSLQSAIVNARAGAGSGAQQVMAEIGKAQQAVDAAIGSIKATPNEAVAEQLNVAGKSLIAAGQHANNWQGVEDEYKPLTQADSVKGYLDAMSAW